MTADDRKKNVPLRNKNDSYNETPTMEGTKMNKLDITKKIATIIVGFGTATIATGIIKNNVAPKNLPSQITVWIAGVVIGMMAADATEAYTSQKIDELVAAWNKSNIEIIVTSDTE